MARRHLEDDLQAALIEHIKLRGRRGLIYFHPANGGKRNALEAARLKRMGVRAGVADLILLRNGHSYALELKAKGGRPTESQMEFMSDWIAAGGSGCIADGIDRALKVLEMWGLIV